jgi:hypothetical protein
MDWNKKTHNKTRCPMCLRDFELQTYQRANAEMGHPVYCSLRCSQEMKHWNHAKEANCTNCNDLFILGSYDKTRRQQVPGCPVYCKATCKEAYVRKLRTTSCFSCGDTFYANDAQWHALKRYKPQYCTPKCKSEYREKIKLEEAKKVRECLECKTEYTSENGYHLCSLTCFQQFIKKNQET